MARKINFEGETTGTCKCCGQLRIIPEDVIQPYKDGTMAGEVPPDLIDWLAMMNCSCDDSRIEQNKQKVKEEAKANVRKLFEHEHPSASDYMLKAIDLMLEGKMGNISIQIGKWTRATITKNAKGDIKVKRTITKVDELEA